MAEGEAELSKNGRLSAFITGAGVASFVASNL
jgi:hypothetical protein